MSIMSNSRIIGNIYDGKLVVKPFIYDNVQPVSIDLILDKKIMIPLEAK